MIKIDFSLFESREQFHQCLKELCQFPDYYGCNLDAMYDCLSEGEYSFEIVEQQFNGYQSAIMNVMKDAGCIVNIKGNNQ